MDMQEALRALIVADSAVAAIAGTRVYWGVRPQDKPLPAIVLQTVSDPRPQHLKGFETFRGTRVQADCLAATFAQARALAEAVIAAAIGPAAQGGVTFQRGDADGPRDLGEDTANGYVHNQSVDLLIRHDS
jgi:hypothetical protein